MPTRRLERTRVTLNAQLLRLRAPGALESRLYRALRDSLVLDHCVCSVIDTKKRSTAVFRWSWHRYHIVVMDNELLMGDTDCAYLLGYQASELSELVRDLKRAVERRVPKL
jgi:hypothetical protein